MKNKNNKDTLRNLALVTQIGLSVITPILIGVYLGQLLDKKFGLNGVFSITFIVIGAAAGFLNIFNLSKRK